MRGELHPTRDRDEPDATVGQSADAAADAVTDADAFAAGASPDVAGASPDGQIADVTSLGPTGPVTRRNMVFATLFILAAIVGLYFLVPKFAGLNQTWGQLRHGNALWLAVAAGLELLSVGCYAILFRTVFARGFPRLSWRASIEIPLAGIAAIRLLAAAGAGGVAVTVWALRRAGMAPRLIACRMTATYAIQYSLYLLAIIVCGFGLYAGVFAGQAPTALTLLPALLSTAALALGAAMGLLPDDFERRLEKLSRRSGRIGRLATRFATLPATLGSGVRTALGLVRERRVGLLGAVGYWAFDIAVLGVSFKAFGATVPIAVLILGYFLGTLGSLLPLPGGIGGVEGGMIGAFAAFGIPADKAVIAVLAYRAISFWLPTLPGVAGYASLRSTVRGWRVADSEAREPLKEG